MNGYWNSVWKQFKKNRLGYGALFVLGAFILVGIYAPFLASSKPLVVYYHNEWYFPLFRYLFYSGFFSKKLDLFFNLLIFIFPAGVVVFKLAKGWIRLFLLGTLLVIQMFLFLFYSFAQPRDPAADPRLAQEHQQFVQEHRGALPDWERELSFMTPYAKLNLILREQRLEQHHREMVSYRDVYTAYAEKYGGSQVFPTLWNIEQAHENERLAALELQHDAQGAAALKYIKARRLWLEQEVLQLHYEVMPVFSHFHWEDDAGGEPALNQFLKWWELSRVNRKDLLSALIFGVRISVVVGIIAVSISLLIGVPIGAFSGYYGGTFDIIVSRLLEIWEAMPTFFMLLLVVAMTQSKSIFLVIAVIGVFGWTGFTRFLRGEFFKQRNLPYVEACKALGFDNRRIMFIHILPNAIPPLLTLLPFAIMGAITGEAGLSFLGLGEEGSCSWGVLMDEGRTAFPGESYLLWPPAILLTVLLVAIALVGDACRDALDPKLAEV